MGSVKSYKCLNCKAPLTFDPSTQEWKCDYCFSHFDKGELDASPLNQDHPESETVVEDEGDEIDVYHCENCGAELVADHTTAATFCLYCKSPSIIKTRFSGKFKPTKVIPFKIQKKEAEDLYRKWIRKALFAPRDFKEDEEIEKVTGMYAPFWMYNSKVTEQLAGQGTRVSAWRSGNYNYTKTKYYNVSRKISVAYNQVPVDGSKKLDDTLMQMIEPYDYHEIKPFSMQYMSGFLAERYDVDEPEARKTAESRIEDFAKTRVRGTVSGYNSFTPNSSETSYDSFDNEYVLMPVYILNNIFQGKDHIFLVNGQTGKVVGQTPLSRKKQFLFAAAVFIGSWLAVGLGGALLG